MEQLFKDFLTEISPALQTLIVALVTLLLGQASVYLNKQRQILNAKLTAEQRQLLDFLAYRAVQTVQQLYKSDPAQEKLNAAKNIVEMNLASYGLTVDVDVILAAIEAQVFEQFKAPSLTAPKG